VAIRKGLRWEKKPWKKQNWQKLWNWVFCILCGYGGRPVLVIGWAFLVVFGTALILFLFKGVEPYSLTPDALMNSLYLSAVSFTALGYGSWLGTDFATSWAKALGAAEAFVGVFMISLFLVTFVRKMVR